MMNGTNTNLAGGQGEGLKKYLRNVDHCSSYMVIHFTILFTFLVCLIISTVQKKKNPKETATKNKNR